jgi:hypothetical protein
LRVYWKKAEVKTKVNKINTLRLILRVSISNLIGRYIRGLFYGSKSMLRPKQVALAVLSKVGEVLKKSTLLQSLKMMLPPSYKPEPRSDGKMGTEAAPEHPEAGKHPS